MQRVPYFGIPEQSGKAMGICLVQVSFTALLEFYQAFIIGWACLFRPYRQIVVYSSLPTYEVSVEKLEINLFKLLYLAKINYSDRLLVAKLLNGRGQFANILQPVKDRLLRRASAETSSYLRNLSFRLPVLQIFEFAKKSPLYLNLHMMTS